MKAVTRVTFLDEEGEKFFGEGPARLMRGVEQQGSLRAAAMAMKMAYTKALKLVKQAEAALGFPLITRTTGGKTGGGSVLTLEGKQWLSQYEAYRDACVKSNQELYKKFFPQTGCVIMASGMSKRFGSNKLMADFHGAPLIQQALDVTKGLFTKRVVVTRHESVAKLCREQKVEVILHDLPGRNDTVRLGLEALPDLEACMFLPGDQPLLQRETVMKMLEAWKEKPDHIIRPIFEGNEGSPVLFPAWTFPELKNLPEGKGGGVVIKAHPQQLCCVPVQTQYELIDADTPEILKLLQQLMLN